MTLLAVDDDPIAYPPRYAGLPVPLPLPFELKPVSSADSGVDHLPDGRTRYWIRHDVVRGVTPANRAAGDHPAQKLRSPARPHPQAAGAEPLHL